MISTVVLQVGLDKQTSSHLLILVHNLTKTEEVLVRQLFNIFLMWLVKID